MNPTILLLTIVLYFATLFCVSYFTSKGKTSNTDFFNASKNSNWLLVAYGMIGATLSGVTFVSVPGLVNSAQFSYLQMVFGFVLGYIVIIYLLLPLYYKRNLVSIYEYLNQRFGFYSHKTGSMLFIVSRVIGAAFRLYLVAMVLFEFVFKHYGIPFWGTVLISLIFIWSYTAKAGIKTVLWTDLLQTTFMLLTAILVIISIVQALNLEFNEVYSSISNSGYSKVYHFSEGWGDPNNFFKLLLAGMFMAIVMTGLDQDMMQKNISCKTLAESQKNMKWFSGILIFVNILFLAMGALLFIYAESKGVLLPTNIETGAIINDKVFPTIAFEHLSIYVSIAFLIGLLAAAYSSSDSALTALTTSFCIDILGEPNPNKTKRMLIHLGFSMVLFMVILVFRYLMDDSAIKALFIVSGYTYGPLLGLFAFGLFTKRQVVDRYVPFLAVVSPVITYVINENSEFLLAGYKFGFELLLLNGLLTFLGLWFFSKKTDKRFI